MACCRSCSSHLSHFPSPFLNPLTQLTQALEAAARSDSRKPNLLQLAVQVRGIGAGEGAAATAAVAAVSLHWWVPSNQQPTLS